MCSFLNFFFQFYKFCSQPVPGKRGEAPDIAVGEHIDRDCQSDPAKQKRKVITFS